MFGSLKELNNFILYLLLMSRKTTKLNLETIVCYIQKVQRAVQLLLWAFCYENVLYIEICICKCACWMVVRGLWYGCKVKMLVFLQACSQWWLLKIHVLTSPPTELSIPSQHATLRSSHWRQTVWSRYCTVNTFTHAVVIFMCTYNLTSCGSTGRWINRWINS